MILYDEKLNFLGMSERTLNFLGYEDIDEFMSMNKDVADLFVKEEGYIHKFDNFSWIDFILYSGSETKKAIIKLKDGNQSQIDISIKEILLQKKVDDNKKLYSVKLISDNFQNISETKNENTKRAVGNFSLNNMLSEEDKIAGLTKPEKIEEPATTFKKLDQTDTIPKQPTNENKLNFLDEEIQNNTVAKTEPILNDNIQNIDFKLDRPDDNLNSSGKLNFLQKNEQNTIEQPSINLLNNSDEGNNLNFSLKSLDDKQEEIEEQNIFTNDRGLDFNLKSKEMENPKPQKQENNSLDFLNILKSEDESNLNTTKTTLSLDIKEQKQEEAKNNSLDFLNFSNEDDSSDNDAQNITPDLNIQESKPEEAKSNSLDFLNFSKGNEPEIDIEQEHTISIINKAEDSSLLKDIFKQDTDSETNKTIDSKNEEFEETKHKLNFLNKRTIESVNTDKEETKKHVALDQTEKIQMIKQIKQDIKEIDSTDGTKEEHSTIGNISIKEEDDVSDPSFINTLKSLFDEDESQEITKSKDQLDVENNQVFSFNIKKQENSETQINDIKADEPQNITKQTNNSQRPINIDKQSIYASLQSLGLNQEQEQNLIVDFVEDSKESLESMKQFTYVKDFDKIKYCLVKIKSSAEILNLADIITLTNHLKNNCEDKNIEAIIQNHDNLQKYINRLEREILKDTV